MCYPESYGLGMDKLRTFPALEIEHISINTFQLLDHSIVHDFQKS